MVLPQGSKSQEWMKRDEVIRAGSMPEDHVDLEVMVSDPKRSGRMDLRLSVSGDALSHGAVRQESYNRWQIDCFSARLSKYP